MPLKCYELDASFADAAGVAALAIVFEANWLATSPFEQGRPVQRVPGHLLEEAHPQQGRRVASGRVGGAVLRCGSTNMCHAHGCATKTSPGEENDDDCFVALWPRVSLMARPLGAILSVRMCPLSLAMYDLRRLLRESRTRALPIPCDERNCFLGPAIGPNTRRCHENAQNHEKKGICSGCRACKRPGEDPLPATRTLSPP